MNAQAQEIRTFHQILADWERAKRVAAEATKQEMALRKEVFAIAFPEATEGTNTMPLANGYKLKGIRKINYKLGAWHETKPVYDAICRLGNEGPFLADRLMKLSIDLLPGEYKKLASESMSEKQAKDLIDAILTTSDGAPTLEICAPK